MHKSVKELSARAGRAVYYAYLTIIHRPKLHYANKEVKDRIKAGSCIIISNHISFNDGPMLYMLFHNSALVIAKDWADRGLLKWVTAGGRFIPVDREGMDISWIHTANEALRNGNNAIIFSEGHTCKDEIREFKPGFVMLGLMSGSPVVPLYIEKSRRGGLFKRKHIFVGTAEELSDDNKGMNQEYLLKESHRFFEIISDMRRKFTVNE